MERRELLTGLAFVGAASVAGPVADELNNSYWAPAIVKKGLDFLQTRRVLAQDLRPFEPSKEFILADVVSEQFRFFTGSRGLSELVHKFADAHLQRLAETGETEDFGADPHAYVETYASIFRRSTQPEQGICNGVSNYMALKKGIIPEISQLGQTIFDNANLHEISGLGGVLHLGDAQVQEGFTGDMLQAGFLQYMINKYLRHGQKFVMSISRESTWTLPIDGYLVNSINQTGEGWKVDLVLRGADYTDQPKGVKGYRNLKVVYVVDSLDNPTRGQYTRYPNEVNLLDLWYPNPNRSLLLDTQTNRFIGDQALEKASSRPGTADFRIQWRVFTKKMVESFNILASPATTLDCSNPRDIYCRPY